MNKKTLEPWLIFIFFIIIIIMQVWNKQSVVTQTDAAGKRNKEGAAPKM